MEVFTKLFNELHQLISWVADFIYWSYAIWCSCLIGSTWQHAVYKAILDKGLFVVLLYVGLLIMFVVQAILDYCFGLQSDYILQESKVHHSYWRYFSFFDGGIAINCRDLDKTSWCKCWQLLIQ